MFWKPRSHVVVVHLTTDNLDEVGIALELHILNLHLVHLVDDARIVGSKHLSSIFPISLVAVVFLRIVACCYVHASLCAKLTDGKADLGRGSKALEEIDLDAIGREDVGNGFSEETAIVATVMTDHNAQALLPGESLINVIRKALSRHTHDILVHAVCASAHDAAQSTCSELQVLIESIHKGSLVLVLHHCLDFLLCLLVIVGRVEPSLSLSLAIFDKLYVHNFKY